MNTLRKAASTSALMIARMRNVIRQLPVSSSSPTDTGAVMSAPSGVLRIPTETDVARSAGAAHADMVLFMTE